MVIGCSIVMIGIGGFYTSSFKYVSKAEGHIIFMGTVKAPNARLGNETRAGGIFSVGCGDPPDRSVKIFKSKALLLHFIKGWCKLGMYCVGRKTFRHNHNKIVALIHTCILIFVCRLFIAEIFIHEL